MSEEPAMSQTAKPLSPEEVRSLLFTICTNPLDSYGEIVVEGKGICTFPQKGGADLDLHNLLCRAEAESLVRIKSQDPGLTVWVITDKGEATYWRLRFEALREKTQREKMEQVLADIKKVGWPKPGEILLIAIPEMSAPEYGRWRDFLAEALKQFEPNESKRGTVFFGNKTAEFQKYVPSDKYVPVCALTGRPTFAQCAVPSTFEVCPVELREAGKSYPRSCYYCGIESCRRAFFKGTGVHPLAPMGNPSGEPDPEKVSAARFTMEIRREEEPDDKAKPGSHETKPGSEQ